MSDEVMEKDVEISRDEIRDQSRSVATEVAVSPDTSRPVSDSMLDEKIITADLGVKEKRYPSDKHTLTTNEVQQLFSNAELARNRRSIERYCKDGKLDAEIHPDEQRYYITPASVDALIGLIKEIQSRQTASLFTTTVATEPRPVATGQRPMPEADATATESQPEEVQGLQDRVKKLEKELAEKDRLLEIKQQVNDQVLTSLSNQMEKSHLMFADKVAHFAQIAGQLGEQVKRLQIPASRPQAESVSVVEDKDANEDQESENINWPNSAQV
jgi:hypothetical protein